MKFFLVSEMYLFLQLSCSLRAWKTLHMLLTVIFYVVFQIDSIFCRKVSLIFIDLKAYSNLFFISSGFAWAHFYFISASIFSYYSFFFAAYFASLSKNCCSFTFFSLISSARSNKVNTVFETF